MIFVTIAFAITNFLQIGKKARIIPLHKRNSTQDPENYRPIFILPLLSKILEKGPFIIHINDLRLDNSTGDTALFADDATISVCNKNIDIVKHNLDLEAGRTYKWCGDNGMVISIDKTKAMLITSRHKKYRLKEAQRDLNINLHGNTIISTKQEKLLGILIDNNLA